MHSPGLKSLKNPSVLLATGFGVGLLPRAPGTWGTLAAVPLAWWLGGSPAFVVVMVVASAVALGVWICHSAGRALGATDHPVIVWDEIAAYLCLTPLMGRDWLWLIAGFVLFRVFDIVKPWPIREVDHRLKGGAGTMLDDLLAAGYSALCLLLLQQLVT